MKILGIDPGIGRTGWAVIEVQGPQFTVDSYDCFETPSTMEFSERLAKIHGKVIQIIEKYAPNIMAVEELFFNTNAKTALIVGHARGVVLLAGAEQNVPLAVYTPLQVKIAVTGYGRAEKQQVGQMVKMLLKLKEIPKPDDVADACAVALTHAFSNKMSAIG